MDKLLGEIPESDSWSTRRENILSASVQHNLLAMDILFNNLQRPKLQLDPQASGFGDVDLPETTQSLLQHTHAYGHLTKTILAEWRFTEKIGLFRELVFMLLCVVMLHVGVPKNLVDLVMKTYVSD